MQPSPVQLRLARARVVIAAAALAAATLPAGCGAGAAPGPDAGGSEAPGPDAAGGAAPPVRPAGTVTLPSGMPFDGTTVGGLSGIDYDPATGRYVVISDDQATAGPTRAYTLDLPLDPDGAPQQPQLRSMIALTGPDGPYPRYGSDTEAVRWAPGGGLLYASEGGAPGGLVPFVREAAPDGAFARDLPLPPAYLPHAAADGTQDRGLRQGLGFEGLALSPDGGTVSVISENALAQDGPEAAPGVPSDARLLRLDSATGRVVAEYVYRTDPMQASGGVIGPSVAGVSALTQVGPGQYLTVERSFALPEGFAVTVYLATTDGATDVAGAAALDGTETPMRKTALFRFDGAANNIEGITVGPVLPDGTRTLVLVADDNMGRVGTTAFSVLTVGPGAGF